MRVTLRLIGVLALVLLLWNPAFTRRVPGGGNPIVLLDASLSMRSRPAQWRAALDTARALAGHGIIWRFGSGVAAFDTAAPADGTSRLAPALAAAAARGGPVTVVTDGAIDDVALLPADLIARARVVVVGAPPGPDAFVSAVEGPHQVGTGDTLTLRVTYGMAGRREAGSGKRGARLVVADGGRTIESKVVALPDSGTLTSDVTLPASLFPRPGWTVLDVRLTWPPDSEPRDDAMAFPLLVSSDPAAVILAAPPDWDATFLARTLGDVARVPVKSFAQIAPGTWNDGTTLAPVPPDQVRKAVAAARLVVEVGDPARWPVTSAAALLTWNTGTGSSGDWYLTPAPASPLSGALATVPWDSLPPALAAQPAAPDSGVVPVLEAQLARRGAVRPVATLLETSRGRRAALDVSGLYRWDFRGGAARQAYRTVVAGLVDWLLAGGPGATAWAAPESLDVGNGLPMVWRWVGSGAPRDLPISLEYPGGARVDTLRFGADRRAALTLPVNTYRYSIAAGHGRGLFVVDENSAEWHAPRVLAPQAGRIEPGRAAVDWRDRWWLFALALAAFAGEWVWRRRLGLP